MSDGATAPALFELPEELAIDTGVARRVIAEFIRGQLARRASSGSSSVCPAGSTRRWWRISSRRRSAPERLLLRPDAVPDVVAVARRRRGGRRGGLGCASELVEIMPMVDGSSAPTARRAHPGRGLDAAPLRRGNFMARMRMSVLYDRSVTCAGSSWDGQQDRVAIGYTTLFGDRPAPSTRSATCTRARCGSSRRRSASRGDHPQGAVRRPLAETDRRGRGGFSYPELDRILFWRIDRGARSTSLSRWASTGRWSSGWSGWSRAPSSSARSRRSRSSGRGRPASTTCTRGAGRLLARAEAVAGGTLYVVATPIGNLGDVTLRALEVLRAVPLIAAEDTRISRRLLDRYDIGTRTASFHAHSGPARERELLDAPRRRVRISRWSPTPARRSPRPGRGARRRLGGGGWPVVADPGRAAVLAAVAASGCRAALGVRGLPAPVRAANDGSASRRSPPTTARRSCSRRRPARGHAARPRRGLRRRPSRRRLPRAHEAPRAGRPRHARRARARRATARSRPAGEVVIVVGWGSGERARTRAAAAADDALVAARAEVERAHRGRRAARRGREARRRCNGHPAPRPLWRAGPRVGPRAARRAGGSRAAAREGGPYRRRRGRFAGSGHRDGLLEELRPPRRPRRRPRRARRRSPTRPPRAPTRRAL